IFPWELGEKADPFAPAPAGIRPGWYFLAPFYTLELIPSHVFCLDGELVGILGVGLVGGWGGAVPVWAVTREGAARVRWVTGAGVLLVSYLATFSALGYVR